VREALFSILYDELADSHILDLFAGSGSFGIEALSRGAQAVTFVEQNRKTVAVLKDNLESVSLQEKAHVFNLPAERALPKLRGMNQKFEICFLDPPYDAGILETSFHTLIGAQLMAESGCVICEHHSRSTPPTPPAGWNLQQTRSYGDVAISFYQRQTDEEAP